MVVPYNINSRKLFSLPVAAENIDNLVGIELLHLVTGRTAVFARVELCRLLVEDLTDGGGHGKT